MLALIFYKSRRFWFQGGQLCGPPRIDLKTPANPSISSIGGLSGILPCDSMYFSDIVFDDCSINAVEGRVIS
jgi:hypothetical protein